MVANIPESLKPAFERKAHPYLVWDALLSTPQALEDVFTPQSQEAIRRAAEAMKDRAPIHLVGCGTSYFSAIAATFVFHSVSSCLAWPYNAFEFWVYPPPSLERSTLVAISHTGSTPAVIRAAELARERGACTVGLTDDMTSPLARSVDYAICGSLGREPALPKTRSYAAALLRHYLLALELAKGKGKDISQFRDVLLQSPRIVQEVLQSTEPQIKGLAQGPLPTNRIVVVGGGPQVATANEGALKLIEMAEVDADAWELEEAVHGTWASTTKGDWVIVLAMKGPSFVACERLVAGMKAIDVDVWAITNEPDGVKGADHVTYLPGGIPELFMPLFAILPLYQFAYHLALARAIHPDIMRLDDPRYLEARMIMRQTSK